nr:hypothetical protein [Jannaschia seohaensis]
MRASSGNSGGSVPFFSAALTAAFHASAFTSANLADFAHASRASSASRRKGRSAASKGARTEAMAGDFPALGLPIAIVQRVGGSDHPGQIVTQRALPIAADATARSAAKT